MQIGIDLHYFVNGMKTLQCGYFKVNVREFKINPDEEAARVALEWFKKVKRNFNYEVNLYKVLYNQIDITELVKVKEVNLMKDPGVGGSPILKDPGTGGGAIFKDPGTGS
ncbi:hypothetical protein M4D55_25115 [Metabacillus idriensis]|uniref:hypothetical protein n=1 Tax=Metabacillus idriensis TaxID=324768 RepID=UPI00174BB159|nr:hypothetical protein [Metabacillus idriensis]MCM3599022.1 hypothetical protein [Metabacillus idriensis]